MPSGSSSRIFINEIHYDNAGTDTGEFVEVANPDGSDLTGWTIVLYNGANGASYGTLSLSGSDPFASLAAAGIQNGAPDGLALVDPMGNVVQFLSYEGTFTATNGPAAGLASVDIGVAEAGTEAVGQSLQLTGTGSTYGDFAWASDATATAGAANNGQSFGGAPQHGALAIGDAQVIEGDSGTSDLVFTVTRSGGASGAVSADWSVAFNGSADAADLGAPLSGTVSFADGATSAAIHIAVNGDTLIENDETFSLALANPAGGVTIGDGEATGTIRDDDTPVAPATVFINEIHYDNAGTDANEGIEIAGAAGTDLSGWSLVLYNGSNTPAAAPSYGTIALSGVIGNQDDGFGTIEFALPVNGLQNGDDDGMALVDPSGHVVQFLSYEGTMTAANGPAAGLTSTDIGVAEDSGTALGLSLQLTGSGSEYSDFTWSGPLGQTAGAVNAGQDFVAPNPNGSFYLSDASATEGDSGTTEMTFLVRRAGGTEGAVSVDYAVHFTGGQQGADAGDFSGPTSGTVSFAAGQVFAQITIPVAGDTAPEPTERFDLVLSNPTGGADIHDGIALGTIVNDEQLDLQIGQIQGEGHSSPYADNTVTTDGVVTALASNGFYLQDADGDGNSATSDAIFVFTDTAPTVAVGDQASVTGTVTEYLPGGDPTNLTTTELNDVSVTVESSGHALPDAVLIGADGVTPPTEIIEDDHFATYDPAQDGMDFWESLEGMRVTIEHPVTVDSTNSFGELWTVASDGAGHLAATSVADSGLVTVQGGEGSLGTFNQGAGSDFNPERIQIDGYELNGQTFDPPVVTPGTTLDNVTGILDYSFGNYELLPTEAVTVAAPSTTAPETTDLMGAANQLTVASYNVLNLDINDTDGDMDVADGRFAHVASDIATNLHLPDIVVLEEVQDDSGSANDGTVSAAVTLQALCDEIYADSGVLYSFLDNPYVTDNQTGGEPGGNIRVAFLYRPDQVSYQDGSAFTITDPDDGQLAAAFQGTRAPLGADFTFNGETVTVIGNHFTSKLGSETTFSADQLPVNTGESTRAAQAAAENAYLDAMLATDPNAHVVVAGDFNEFQFEEPMQVLTGQLDYEGGQVSAGDDVILENLTYMLAAQERYSTLFEGNAQQIDHILATTNLSQSAAFDIVHVNVPTGADTSDHDPVLARFNVGTETIAGGNGAETLTGNDGNDVITGGNGDDVLIGNGGDDTLSGGSGNDTLDGGTGNDSLDGGKGNDMLDGGAGADRLTGGQGDDTFVLHADGGDADGDTIADFGAKSAGHDTILIDDAGGRAISFVQDGADTLVLADGTQIATVLDAKAAAVAAAASYDGSPTSMSVDTGASLHADSQVFSDSAHGRALPTVFEKVDVSALFDVDGSNPALDHLHLHLETLHAIPPELLLA